MMTEIMRGILESIFITLGIVIKYQLFWEVLIGVDVLALIGFLIYNKMKGGE